MAAELLFEMGSEDRLRILGALKDNPMKLSQLAQAQSSTIQEVSRQCGRLEESGLIERHPDTRFGLTGVGKIALALLPSFKLLHDERDYFRTHDFSSLPLIFLERMGELAEHVQITHIDDALKFQQRVVKESTRFVWFMSDQPVGHSFREDHSHFSQSTTLRMVLPRNVDTDVFRGAKKLMGSRLEIGLVDNINVVLAMNEEVAAVSIPTLDGRADYSRGFAGESPSFHGWCRDLFLHYWDKSMKKYSE